MSIIPHTFLHMMDSTLTKFLFGDKKRAKRPTKVRGVIVSCFCESPWARKQQLCSTCALAVITVTNWDLFSSVDGIGKKTMLLALWVHGPIDQDPCNQYGQGDHKLKQLIYGRKAQQCVNLYNSWDIETIQKDAWNLSCQSTTCHFFSKKKTRSWFLLEDVESRLHPAINTSWLPKLDVDRPKRPKPWLVVASPRQSCQTWMQKSEGTTWSRTSRSEAPVDNLTQDSM